MKIVALLSSVTLCLAVPVVAQTAEPSASRAPPRFEGRLLVSVSDADMLPSAYKDDLLGPAVGPDALSVVRLDGRNADYRAVEVAVSNSVAGPPSSVAVTPDGRYAVVIETVGARRSAATTRLSQLGAGRLISLVDLRQPEKPLIVQRVEGFEAPLAVAIDPTGTLVAITHRAKSGTPPIALYKLAAGRLSAAMTPTLPDWKPGATIIAAAFHPREPVLALVDVSNAQLSFVRFATTANGDISLSRWGNTLTVEKDSYLVRFTPDARHVLVNGSYASADFNLEFSGAPRGSVDSYRVAASIDADNQPRHRFVDRVETGVIPEGMDVSPDGRFVITANLERSTPRPGDADMTRYASMSLIRLDPQTGRLKRVGDYAFDGALPEMAVFDNSSRFVAVTVFSQFDDPRARGSIDFWRIEGDPLDPERVEMVKTRHSIPVTRGPHTLAIVR